MSILESIANGYTTPNEISGNTGIKSSTLNQYLDRLKKLRLIKKENPVTASEKSKRSIYIIKENFIHFWFHSIAPRKSGIEENPENALESIQSELTHEVASTFEKVCREAVKQDLDYREVGRWWYKEDEIDVAGLKSDSSSLFLGECKWTCDKPGLELLQDLENKEGKIQWQNGERDVEYGLFSKSGFTDELMQAAKSRNDLALYSTEDLKSILTSEKSNFH